ncbi:extensin family protein [bacterium]|nr:extensin family protein [bacterium]
MSLIDLTDALGVPLWYDRSTLYGVPHPTKLRFKGTGELRKALELLGKDLKKIGWLDYIEKILTAGVYVNKPGAHKEGIAVDFDGAVVRRSPSGGSESKVYVYKAGRSDSLARVTATRLACLIARRFGVVLTAGYNRAHEDHIHADLSRPVKWYGSVSQVILVQETLNAWYGAGLKVDGIAGKKVRAAWSEASGGQFVPTDFDYGDAFKWLLDTVAFNPPIQF